MRDAIDELSDHKDPGSMGSPASVFKYNKNLIGHQLTALLSATYRTGDIPVLWKESFVTPVPKKGDAMDVASYRGIALQSVIPKIFDKFLKKSMRTHIDRILSPTQHGFRARRRRRI